MAGVIRFELKIDNSVKDAASVSYTESTWQEIVVADAASDSQLNFGGVTTADVFYLKSDQALTLNINSSTGTDITVDANKPFFSAGCAITALYLSNASGSNANVTWGIWGA